MNATTVIQHGKIGNDAVKHSSNLKESKRSGLCQKYDIKDRMSRTNGE